MGDLHSGLGLDFLAPRCACLELQLTYDLARCGEFVCPELYMGMEPGKGRGSSADWTKIFRQPTFHLYSPLGLD